MSTVPEGELEAAVAAREELGREREPQVIEAFLDRIEQGIDKRIDERLARRRTGPAAAPHEQSIKLALGSMALGIGVTAVSTSNAGGGGIAISIIAWIAIAVINVAYALRR